MLTCLQKNVFLRDFDTCSDSLVVLPERIGSCQLLVTTGILEVLISFCELSSESSEEMDFLDFWLLVFSMGIALDVVFSSWFESLSE